MSRLLSELLGTNNLSFRLSIEQLEKASGNPGADIRLTSETIQQAQSKVKELGLDPQDTTNNELYGALLEKLKSDNTRLENALGHQKENNKITPSSIVKTIKALSIPKSCFALKHSVAKRLLKSNPPKLTMKRLGYRSLDSLLKREAVSSVFSVANTIEPTAWHKKMLDQYKKLQPSDYETREIEVIAPGGKHWDNVTIELASKGRQPVLVSKELGSLLILRVPLETAGSTMATLFLVLQSINEIRIHSAFCKLQQVKPNFGEIISDSLKGNVRSLVLIAGQPLPWYVIQKHYSRFTNEYPLELFEPHVHKEDLQLIQCEDVLSYIEPTLEFWQNSEALGISEKHSVVSLNLLDIAINCCNKIPFSGRIISHFRENLWSELLLRYLQQKEVEHAVVRQLDAQLIDSQSEPNFSLSFA